jgi:hypothetical protein
MMERKMRRIDTVESTIVSRFFVFRRIDWVPVCDVNPVCLGGTFVDDLVNTKMAAAFSQNAMQTVWSV